MHITNLRCEYLRDPLAITASAPRLSWTVESDRRGAAQTAFQLEVTQEDGAVTWDSGRVASAETLHHRYAGTALMAGARYVWRVRVWDEQDVASGWSAPAHWTMSVWMGQWSPESGPSHAVWIGAPLAEQWNETQSPPALMLRKDFSLLGPVKRAVLYASALGVYELRLNGQRVGDQRLAPEWTDYTQKVQYQGYDVTTLLSAGGNALGAQVGAGWYAGRMGMAENYTGVWRGVYGRRLAFIAQLCVELEDGTRVTVLSDGSWRCTTEGPIRSADLLDGEAYDARREQSGWEMPGFDDAAWTPAASLRGPKLVAQPNEPIRITRTLAPVGVSAPQPGVYIFDLGQNMVGGVRLALHGEAGAQVRLRYGEALNPDGTLYRDNLRGAPQIDTYVCRGGAAVCEPLFTYHGFRFVEVTGLTAAPAPTDLTGLVFHSAGQEVGEFACSSDLLNRIMSAIQWTQRANFYSTPTDCPQRDERLGWTGDAQVFAQTAIFNMDLAAFYTKWCYDIREAQADDGRLPDFAPHPYDPNQRFSGNPGWGDAGVIVPWRVYVNYGDTALLGEMFEAARRYVDWSLAHNPDLIWRDASQLIPLYYGEWLNADTFADLANLPRKGGEVPKEIYATAFWAHAAQLVARMAEVLGKEAEAAAYGELAHRITAAFNQQFVTSDGKITGDTQAGYALALNFDLLPDRLRPLAARHMVAALVPYDGGLSTGIQCTVRMMVELSRYGYHAEAYALMTRTTIPSWGYMVEHGGTTIWERWDGFVEGRGFQNPGMNSFNHYAIGAVGEWMYRVIGGLTPDEAHPGWRHFTVRPIPGGDLTWATVRYDSIRGPITVAWRLESARYTVDVTVPANTTVTIHLPPGEITESGQPFAATSSDPEGVQVNVGSGSYRFACEMKE